MKYFLAIDEDVMRRKEKIKPINLGKINKALDKDNNLRALCSFTTTFKNKRELCAFLQKQGLISTREMDCDLLLYSYEDDKIFNAVAYRADAKYLDFRQLEEIIYKNRDNKGFLSALIRHYANYKYLSREIYAIKSYLAEPYLDYKLYDVIRSFVDKLCFRQINSKRIFKFDNLYNLGMLVSKLLLFENRDKNVTMPKNETPTGYKPLADSPGSFHLEELEERLNKKQEGQTRLF